MLFILLLTSCANQSIVSNNIVSDFNFSTKEYVDLYDYKNIHIDYDYIQVSDQDIETVINNDLSYYECYKPIVKDFIENDDIVLLRIVSNNESDSFQEFYYIVGSAELGDNFDSSIVGAKLNDTLTVNIGNNKDAPVKIIGVYTYATYEDTDIVCSYYKLDNMEEVYEKIKERTKTEIIFNFMYDKILENSRITRCPSIVNNYIKRYEHELKQTAQKEELSVEEYARLNSGMTFSEMLNFRKNYYYEIMIINAILENEKATITTTEVDDNIKLTAQQNHITENEVREKYIEEVYYNSIYKKLKKNIVKYVIVD